MVKLNLVQSGNASLAASQPLVAVFVGGTSGIGAHTIKSLAATHGKEGKGLRAYIIGRNAKAAEEIMSDCKKLCPIGQFHFIRANDLALMKDVDLICAELIQLEEEEANKTGGTPRIDILVMTQAILQPWDPRKGRSKLSLAASASPSKLHAKAKILETSEGLDAFMSLLYYSRMRFTTRVLPLLLASSLPAHAISVFGPGRDTTFIPTDLSLRSPQNYGFINVGSHAAYLTTFFMEHLAAQNPGKLALVHYYPGLIPSAKLQDPAFPFWFRGLFRYGAPLIRLLPITLGAEESGERTLFNASPRFPPRSVDGSRAAVAAGSLGPVGVAESSDGVLGGGSYRVNFDNEQVATPKQYKKMREEGWLEKAVGHTLKAFEEIEAGRVFTG